jgi:hypothetical protein
MRQRTYWSAMPKSVSRAGWVRWVAAIVAVVLLGVVGALAREQGTEEDAGIAGSWQGTLDTGKNSRIVVKVRRDGEVGWQGVVYFLDSPNQRNTTTMSVEGGVVRFAIADGDAAWEIPKADVAMAHDADPDWEAFPACLCAHRCRSF